MDVTSPTGITLEELQLAARNHGMPLEALREPVTPAGLHYLLIHFDIPVVDTTAWRLRVGGEVRHPLELTLEELRSRASQTLPVTIECAGNGRAHMSPRAASQPWLHEAVGNAEWTGTPLAPILEEAGLAPSAQEIVFTGLDRGIQGGVEHAYERSLTLGDALRDDVLLAYAMNGERLLPQHGFPLRLIVPGWYGMTHVKWLHSLTATAVPFRGWQQEVAYKLRSTEDDAGEPVTRMQPRSLVVPPGVPEFLSRTRFLDAGPCLLTGRAWSGWAPIDRVEVSVDGGATWADAALDPPAGDHAWRGWRYEWDATAGERELCCRATDAAGNVQPLEPDWNLDGYCNNAVQRVHVTVA